MHGHTSRAKSPRGGESAHTCLQWASQKSQLMTGDVNLPFPPPVHHPGLRPTDSQSGLAEPGPLQSPGPSLAPAHMNSSQPVRGHRCSGPPGSHGSERSGQIRLLSALRASSPGIRVWGWEAQHCLCFLHPRAVSRLPPLCHTGLRASSCWAGKCFTGQSQSTN